jgi:hypothetical protein
MTLQPFVGPWRLFQFLDLFTQEVGLPERGMSPSQDRYLHTEQHKHRIKAHRHPCLRPRGHCDWLYGDLPERNLKSEVEDMEVIGTEKPL